MKTYLLLASVAGAFAATPALAQTAANFSGPRIEARVGYDAADLGMSVDDGTSVISGSETESGLAYGAEVGYDVSLGNVTLGAYAGLDFSDVGYCETVFGQDEACIEAGRNLTIGARVGVPIGQSTLLYVKGGYSNGRLEARYGGFENILDDVQEEGDVEGFHLGAGGELNVSRNLYVKGEYQFTNYGDFNYDDGDFAYASDLTRHQVMFGVGLRF